MKSFSPSRLAAFAAATLFCANTFAAPVVVDGFGAGGWKSWDTRDASGTRLLGTGNSHAGYPGGTYSGAADPLIAQQIQFLGEGVVSNDVAGGTPDASPAGSLNGMGYVRLDGTDQNAGKSDFSYVGAMGSASQLLDDAFEATYRYYNDLNPTSRTVGFNIDITDGGSNVWTLSYIFPGNAAGWNTATVDSDSVLRIYGSAAPGGANPPAPGGGTSMSILDWAADNDWGGIFASSNEIVRVGFNIGSYQRNNVTYVDWLETSLLNGGDVIDFQSAAATVPAPASLALLAGGVLLLRRRRG